MWRCGIGRFLFSFHPLFVSLAVKSSWYFPGSWTETSRFGLLSLWTLKWLSDARHFCGDFNLFLLALSLTCCVETCTFPPPGSITLLQQRNRVLWGGQHTREHANPGQDHMLPERSHLHKLPIKLTLTSKCAAISYTTSAVITGTLQCTVMDGGLAA